MHIGGIAALPVAPEPALDPAGAERAVFDLM
jgi:hypothetical protein